MPDMLKSILCMIILFCIVESVSYASISLINDHNAKQDSILQQYALDTIKFVLINQSKIQKTHSDTLQIEIDGKQYLIPYKVVIASVAALQNVPSHFAISGLSLREYKNFRKQIQELFNNPREKLAVTISAKDWRNSNIYDQYFRPYDNNRDAAVNTDSFEDVFIDESKQGIIPDDINFPLPESIDMEVDLRNELRILTILGLDFNFSKLDKEFQNLLLNFKDTKGRSGNKTILD